MPSLSHLLRLPARRADGLLVPNRSELPEIEGTNATMTIGEFWSNVTTLCHVFNGRVTSGPRSVGQNRAVGGVVDSYHLSGRGADVVLHDWADIDAFKGVADRLGIKVIDEIEKKNHLHLQPK